jgi:hypothetical protein
MKAELVENDCDAFGSNPRWIVLWVRSMKRMKAEKKLKMQEKAGEKKEKKTEGEQKGKNGEIREK